MTAPGDTTRHRLWRRVVCFRKAKPDHSHSAATSERHHNGGDGNPLPPGIGKADEWLAQGPSCRRQQVLALKQYPLDAD
jgi:hypothetical protein